MTTGTEHAKTTATPWAREHRRTTAAIVLLITIGAFEALGVNTAMPTLLADLDATHLYSWPFTVFLSATLISTVVGGRVADRLGPAAVLWVAPAVFVAGLVVAGTAGDITQLLVGRALQGAGIGAEVTAVYVLIASVFPERARPAAFAVMSLAWVVPSIVGPAASGLVTEHLGWRWVFLGLAPLAVLGAVLLVPALRGLPPHTDTGPGKRWLVPAAAAAAVAVPLTSWALGHTALLWLGAIGLVVLVVALRVLLPKGTLVAARGLPRVVLARGLFAGVFFSVEAFVPLTLTAVHGYPPALAGLPLTLGALGWAAGSQWQGRHPDTPRTSIIRWGFALLAAGMLLVAPAALPGGPGWLVVLAWLVAGAGMGLAYPSVNTTALAASAPNERGFTSSALQVVDTVGSAAAIALGGLLLTSVASAAEPTAAVLALVLGAVVVALAGVFLFRGRGAV
ncbi:MFS transporter [Actinokineospora sp. G85]|uniref:MFS transporter n=1 Tax=Actinokineospora sp. G85 TaxID=3406626 RepID=UPI003C7745DC